MVAIIKQLLAFLKKLSALAVSFLPDSPFAPYISKLSGIQWLGALNYFIPVGDFIAILAVWVTAVGIFFVASMALRFVKAID